jgi:hypothetical protein
MLREVAENIYVVTWLPRFVHDSRILRQTYLTL